MLLAPGRLSISENNSPATASSFHSTTMPFFTTKSLHSSNSVSLKRYSSLIYSVPHSWITEITCTALLFDHCFNSIDSRYLSYIQALNEGCFIVF